MIAKGGLHHLDEETGGMKDAPLRDGSCAGFKRDHRDQSLEEVAGGKATTPKGLEAEKMETAESKRK